MAFSTQHSAFSRFEFVPHIMSARSDLYARSEMRQIPFFATCYSWKTKWVCAAQFVLPGTQNFPDADTAFVFVAGRAGDPGSLQSSISRFW